ncbi:M14 family metallopeptidase, partial [Altibacter sp.]|uniref:M14 family metallopeptidase n=1 Tax=Altibacter sp. TaxID=2024823 RepID=UPI0025876EB2
MKKSVLFLLALLSISCQKSKDPNDFNFTTVFEKSEGIETSTYQEVVEFYTQLSEKYPEIAMYTMDKTDSGEPLHLITFNPDRSFESEFSSEKDKNILLINNGIHPGESDGIDASMLLLRDLAEGKIPAPQHTIIAVIPVYNIGGALNRNSTTRTNQNGPESYGFRGNARNYDLNRDFIKADTRNALAFIDIFKTVDPDLFIDTHVSNGADYQYVLTHLFTQHNKLGGELGNYLHESFMPKLEDSLQNKEWDITPYVNVFNQTPDTGFTQFMDAPRYSTGYAALFNTLGMMVETHMLKPYKVRVEGTYELLKSFIAIADAEHQTIKQLREQANNAWQVGDTYPIQWQIDSSKSSTLSFKGYEGEMIASEITGAQRLKYNRDKPFEKDVPYYNHFKPADSITIPQYYIISKGYHNVVNLLRANGIKCDMIPKDTTATAEVYYIDSYETVRNPYEGHYLHYNTQVKTKTELVKVTKGDYKVTTDQK